MEQNPYESPRAETGKTQGASRIVFLVALLLLMLLATFGLFGYLIEMNAMRIQ